MAKAALVYDEAGAFYGVQFVCPGCAAHRGHRAHGLLTLHVNWLPDGETTESVHAAGKPHWGFNGSLDSPTFAPSVLQRAGDYVCHSFVRDGAIEFLGDCTHGLAGQTVPLPELPEDEED